jgi:signal transduction histidine kinase
MNSNLARFWNIQFDTPLLAGNNFVKLQPERLQKKWITILKKVLQGQNLFLSKRLQLKDKYYWFDISCFPIMDVNGQIRGISYKARDVTERKNQEKLLIKFIKQNSKLKLEQEKVKMLAVVKAQEEERRLISMELHDGVGQMLTALNFKMNKIRDKVYSIASTDIFLSLEEIVKLQKSIYQEVRRISEDLMPQFIHDFPLDQALEQLTIQSFSNTGIIIESVYKLAGVSFDKSLQLALFRIVQEIFNNIIKHSQATKVSIILRLQGPLILLQIKDNGVGFDMLANKQKNGSGLSNIKQRVNMLNGTCTITSCPGGGVQFKIKIPISMYEKN